MSIDREPAGHPTTRKRDGTAGTVTLAQLEAFLAIVRQGGLKRAAHALDIDESTMRERIRNLEAWLDKTLFIRKPTFRLAPDGESFLPTAEALVIALCEARARPSFHALLAIKGMTFDQAVSRPITNMVTGQTYYEID